MGERIPETPPENACVFCLPGTTPQQIQATFSGITICGCGPGGVRFTGDFNVTRTLPFFNRVTWCEWSNWYSQTDPIIITKIHYENANCTGSFWTEEVLFFVYVTITGPDYLNIWLYSISGGGVRPFLHFHGVRTPGCCVAGIYLNDFAGGYECWTFDQFGFYKIAYGGQCEIIGL